MTDEMDKFRTRQRATDGIKMPLSTADGEETEHYLELYGIDSDVFRDREIKTVRLALDISIIEDEKERLAKQREAKTSLVASLVKGWSFDQECTTENVISFLSDAPQIQDQIDRVAGNRSLFFALQKRKSEPTPSTD